MDQILFFFKINKEYILILKFTSVTLVLIHIAGCLWFFVGTLEDDINWIREFGLHKKSVFD